MSSLPPDQDSEATGGFESLPEANDEETTTEHPIVPLATDSGIREADVGDEAKDGDKPDRAEHSGEPGRLERVIGVTAANLAPCTWLPDDPTAWPRLIKANKAFNGAFVPLVLHDPPLSERSIDAAEWAAEMISLGNGKVLCLAPFTVRDLAPKAVLSARQWNHAVVMIERLGDVAKRFKIELFVKETVGGVAAQSEVGLEPEIPVTYGLDLGNFLLDGFVPTLLVRPE